MQLLYVYWNVPSASGMTKGTWDSSAEGVEENAFRQYEEFEGKAHLELLEKNKAWHQSFLETVHSEMVLRILKNNIINICTFHLVI